MIRPDFPTPPGDWLDEVMGDRPVRVTLLVFWWWLGRHFLVAMGG